MSLAIGCKDLGMDCRFMTEGETEEVVIELLMRHVEAEHAEDWFEIEEIHQAAWKVVRAKAACTGSGMPLVPRRSPGPFPDDGLQ